MGIFRRTAGQKAPDVRAVGLEAAVGIERHDVDLTSSPAPLGIVCGSCGKMGRIDMIDMTQRRAYLTCPACERTWDTDRDAVPVDALYSRPE